MQWKDSDELCNIEEHEAKKKYPQLVFEHYETRLRKDAFQATGTDVSSSD